MRRWRVPDGRFLIEADAAEGRFRVLGVDGRVERTYGKEVHSVEDVLYTFTYGVAGDEFRHFTEAENSWHGTVRHSHTAVFEGLEELGAEAEPTPAAVEASVEAHQSAKTREEQGRQADIDTLADRPAATMFALPKACRQLAERVVRYDDKASLQMLRLLDEAHAVSSALLEAGQLDAAVDLHRAARLLGEAVRHMTFDNTKADGTGPLFEGVLREVMQGTASLSSSVRSKLQAQLRSLLDATEEMREELVGAASYQDRADARLNAAAYRRAAEQVESAARVVAALDRRIAEAP